MATLPDALDGYRNVLLSKDKQILNRLVSTYTSMYARLKDKIDLLVMDIAATQPTQAELLKLYRYKDLMAQIEGELLEYQGFTAVELRAAAEAGVKLGADSAQGLLSTAVYGDASVRGVFNVLPKEAILQMLEFMQDGGPLFTRLKLIAPYTADQVRKKILEGIGFGYNPRKTAAMITDALGIGLSNAMRTVSTAQLWAYREATRATYLVNDDILEGWIWDAKLDSATCMSCINQHGSRHPNTEKLNDHYRGRCAMVPLVKGFPAVYNKGDGEKWFKEQPEAVQRQMMGKGKYDLWKQGKIGIGDFTAVKHDSVYGDMRVEKSLKDLRPREITIAGDYDLTQEQYIKNAVGKLEGIDPRLVDGVEFKYGEIDSAGKYTGQNVIVNKKLAESYKAGNAAEDISRYERRIESLKSRISSGDYSQEEINIFNSKISGYEGQIKNYVRWSPVESPEEVIIHELGHKFHFDLTSGVYEGIDDFLPPSELRKIMGDSYEFKNTLGYKIDVASRQRGLLIGEYATTNSEEYFAECFTSYIKGEPQAADILPELLGLFNKVLR